MSDDLSIPSPTYRVPRHSRGLDPGTRRLALIAGSLGGALLVLIGGWTVIGHRSASVPVIQPESGPIRVKPENPGGMQITGANEDILSGDNGAGSDKLAPPPEVPAPQALRAPPAPPKPQQQAAIAPPMPPPAVVAPAPMAQVAPAAAKPTPTPEKRAVVPAPGHALVQLAAVSSEEAAKAEWQRLEKRMGDLLSHRQPSFTKVEHDGRTLWRVRTGGFSDVTQATSFCQQIRAKGAACAIADF
jgi:hypothetical protein